ncbi:unnamed protein product, partial [Prunus brigantina]
DRLPPTTARLAGLVSEEKAIPLSQKRNLPFISKSGDIVGEFPKTKPKPGVQSPGGSGKSATPMSGKRKREEERNVSEKQTAGKPKRFIPKVAPSGPPQPKKQLPRNIRSLQSLLHPGAGVVLTRRWKLPLFAVSVLHFQ